MQDEHFKLVERLDTHQALKPSLAFWLVILFQLRLIFITALHFFLLQNDVSLYSLLSHFQAHRLFHWIALIPTLIVLLTYWLRRPNYHPVTALIWQQSRGLLILASFISLLTMSWFAWQHGVNTKLIVIIDIVCSAWCIGYLMKSLYLSLLFRSMPGTDIENKLPNK